MYLKKMALTLYKSLVLPCVVFGDVIYDVARKDQLALLENIQNATCRVITLSGRWDSV